MTNVSALVTQAIGTGSPMDGLLEIYNGYAARSRVERMRMKRELAYIKDETLFDTRALFALGEAWRDDVTPVVALAPIAATEVGYGRSGRDAFFAIGSTKTHTFNVPQEVTERKAKAEAARIAAMSPEQQRYYWQSQMMFAPSAFLFGSSGPSHKAAVPPTPKALLPWNPLTRRNLHVLFDADWKSIPVDPYLLERKNNHQFRVVGHWDLTEQERKLMELITR